MRPSENPTIRQGLKHQRFLEYSVAVVLNFVSISLRKKLIIFYSLDWIANSVVSQAHCCHVYTESLCFRVSSLSCIHTRQPWISNSQMKSPMTTLFSRLPSAELEGNCGNVRGNGWLQLIVMKPTPHHFFPSNPQMFMCLRVTWRTLQNSFLGSQTFQLSGSGVGPVCLYSNKHPVDAKSAALRTTLWEPLPIPQ